MTDSSETEKTPADGAAEAPGWIELALAVLLALAAVGTAWAGFQSTKWSGVQANSYAQAGATRTESNRASGEAGQQRLVDVVTLTSWLNALQQEIIADPSVRPTGAYEPDEETLSGFLYTRFRPEFRPAVEAWVATRPLRNPDAPLTPFDLPEYQVESEARAASLQNRADELAAKARDANQRSDNYVLIAVVFALVLFFAGVGGRIQAVRAQTFLFVMALVALGVAVGVLATMPVEI